MMNELTYDKTFEYWLQEKNYVNDGWNRFGSRTREFRDDDHRARTHNKSCFADNSDTIELSESNRNKQFTKKTLNREFSFMLWGALSLRDELQKLKEDFKHLREKYSSASRYNDKLEKENKELKKQIEELMATLKTI